jgi:excisionase family DNA binding protein
MGRTKTAAAPAAPPTTTWATTRELAEHLRCSRDTVYRLVRDGVLTAHYAGPTSRVALFDLAEVDAAMREAS